MILLTLFQLRSTSDLTGFPALREVPVAPDCLAVPHLPVPCHYDGLRRLAVPRFALALSTFWHREQFHSDAQVLNLLFTNSLPLYHVYIPYSVLPSFPCATSSRVYTQWHMAQSLKPSLWPLVTGIYPIPSAGSVYDDLVLFLHAFTPLITFGLICNSFRFACFVNSSLRFLIPNLHPICTCSCLFTPLTEGRSARDLTQAATSQKEIINQTPLLLGYAVLKQHRLSVDASHQEKKHQRSV